MNQGYVIRILMISVLIFTAHGSLFAQASANGGVPILTEATNPTLSVPLYSTDGTCGGSTFEITFGWLATVDDGASGFDVVGMIAYDSSGVPIAADWDGWFVGTSLARVTMFGFGAGINQMTSRPVKIEVYDIVTFPPFGQNTQAIYDDIVAQSATGPLLIEMIYDPTDDVPDCTNLPGASTVPTLGAAGLITLIGLLLFATFVIRRNRQA